MTEPTNPEHTEAVKLTPSHLFHMVEGLRVEWCATHEASFFGLDRCGFYLFNEPMYDGDPDPGRCVVTSRLVVAEGPIYD